MKRAARLYAASWVRDIGPDLRPNDYKKAEMSDEPNGQKRTTKDNEPSTLEDLGNHLFLLFNTVMPFEVNGLSKLRLL